MNSNGNLCLNNNGIGNTNNCSCNSSIAVGIITDTNTTNQQLASMLITVFIAYDEISDVVINGTLLGTVVVRGTGCTCQTIAITSRITKTLTVTMTITFITAYLVANSNTLSLRSVGAT